MTGRISVRLAAPSVPGNWLRHDFRDQVPSYAAPSEPLGGRVVLVEGRRPDLAAERALAERRREEAGVKAGRRPAVIRGAILTLSREAVEDLNMGRVSLESADAAVAAALREEFGNDLLYVVRHADEVSPHWHAAIRNVGTDGRVRRFDRAACSALQDRVGAAIERRVGWRRGIPVKERLARGDRPGKVRHRSVRELHGSLVRDLAEAEKDRSRSLEDLAAVEQERKRLEQKAEELLRRLRQAEERNLEQSALAERYRRRLWKVEQEIERLRGEAEAAERSRLQAEALRKALEASTHRASGSRLLRPLPDSEREILLRVGAYESGGTIFSTRTDLDAAKVQVVSLSKMYGPDADIVGHPPYWAKTLAIAATELGLPLRVYDRQGRLQTGSDLPHRVVQRTR